MKLKPILIALLCSTTIFSYSQSRISSKTCDELPEALQKYLDPEFPTTQDTGNKLSTDIDYSRSIKSYHINHKFFPVYRNNGKSRKDLNSYNEEKEIWFKKNPYFPQYIDTNHPEEDLENFQKAKREWIARYPKEYKELFEAVFNDDELKEKYLFIIQ